MNNEIKFIGYFMVAGTNFERNIKLYRGKEYVSIKLRKPTIIPERPGSYSHAESYGRSKITMSSFYGSIEPSFTGGFFRNYPPDLYVYDERIDEYVPSPKPYNEKNGYMLLFSCACLKGPHGYFYRMDKAFILDDVDDIHKDALNRAFKKPHTSRKSPVGVP